MAYTAEYWEYDSRLLRRWNTDPVEYEWQSPYACFNNNPIYYADPAGLEGTNKTGGGDKGGGGKGKRKANGTESVKNDEGRQPAGSELPNGATSNGDGSVNPGENPAGDPCHHCGANGETVWGIPDAAPAPSESQDGADESPTGTIVGDFIVESTPHYRIYDGFKKGDVGEIFFASNPAAEIVYDGWTAPGKIVYYTAQGDYLKAGGVYVNHVVTGASIMVGMRTPAVATDGEAITEAAKKAFAEEIEATTSEMAGSADEVIEMVFCFAPGTEVLTEKGLVKIEEIKVGDKVYAYDIEKKKWVLADVEKISVREAPKILKVYHTNGVILVTPEHPFFIDRKWKRAGALRKGDIFTTKSGKGLSVDSIVSIDTLLKVYNFEVVGVHTYSIGTDGIIVHNGPCDENFKSVLKKMSSNWLADEPIYKQLQPTGQLGKMMKQFNVKGYNIEELVKMTPRELEAFLNGKEGAKDIFRKLNKALQDGGHYY